MLNIKLTWQGMSGRFMIPSHLYQILRKIIKTCRRTRHKSLNSPSRQGHVYVSNVLSCIRFTCYKLLWFSQLCHVDRLEDTSIFSCSSHWFYKNKYRLELLLKMYACVNSQSNKIYILKLLPFDSFMRVNVIFVSRIVPS